MFHTVAFSEALVTTNLGSLVSPVLDNTVTISGDNLLVPEKVNQLFAACPFVTTGGAVSNIQVQAPSLRELFFPYLQPVPIQATPDTASFIFELMDNPVPLETNEGLNIQSDATSAATAGQQGAVIFLSDGKRTPVTSSRIFTMRCTASITQAANTWVNGALTFGQTLPVGNYDVVGMRAEATGLIAARLNFIGPSAIVRPGCPGNATIQTRDFYNFRMGRTGVWGTFNSLTPPSIDVLGASGTSQVIYLDLIQR